MSHGPGRVERAVERIFTEFPDKTFSTDELAILVYPALTKVEKKHRVAVLRAADKVAARLHWEKWECQRMGWGNGLNGSRTASLVGRGAVYINSLDLWSYAQGRLRIHEFDGAQTQDEWDTRLGQGGDLYKHVVPGGAWWIRVEQKKIQVSGVEPSPELRLCCASATVVNHFLRFGNSVKETAALI